MSRKHIKTAMDFYYVKGGTDLLNQTMKTAMIKLYGISPAFCTVDNAPYIKPDLWMDRLRISPKTMNSLFEIGMLQREALPNHEWGYRLTEEGFARVISKRKQEPQS